MVNEIDLEKKEYEGCLFILIVILTISCLIGLIYGYFF